MTDNYITCCVNSTAEHINDMMDRAREITYETFRKYVDTQDLAEQFGYATIKRPTECGGLKLNEDRAVRFYSSVYRGIPVVVFKWSGIEYVYRKEK